MHKSPSTFMLVHPNAAGLASRIGARAMWAAVPADRDPKPRRCFGTFTHDLEQLVTWLQPCHIDTVAMASTGVYWIPVFELIEQRGRAALLIEPRQLKKVPGPRCESDVLRASVSVVSTDAQFRATHGVVSTGCRAAHSARLPAPSRAAD